MQARRIDGARSLGAECAPSLVAIGNFDGVHRGHRAVLRSAVSLARERELVPCVMTFHPHPSEVLGRGRQAMLTTLDRKVELLGRIDDDLLVVVEPFNLELAAMTPQQFVEELLVSQLRARVVIVGENFRFGKNRAGDLSTLKSLGVKLGFEARAEPLFGDEAGPYSSSRIRKAIDDGDLGAAEALLGRPHSISGRVVEGDRRGRSIGVPTANLADVAELLPPKGVYAGLVDRFADSGGARKLAPAAVNIGDRPTVGAGFSVEAHLLDYDGDLYGATLRVHLTHRIRGERKFDGLQALVAQIRLDIDEARRLLEARRNDRSPSGGWY